jgi:hypothetical protein
MVKDMVEWLHGYFLVDGKEYAFVTKKDIELYNFFLSGKKIAVKDIVVYEVEKYEGETDEQK